MHTSKHDLPSMKHSQCTRYVNTSDWSYEL